MDQQIQKLNCYLDQYIGKTIHQIIEELGEPKGQYCDEIIVYSKICNFFFKDEITFIMKDERVYDLVITEYLFWIPLHNIFHFENRTPEFKVAEVKFFNRFKSYIMNFFCIVIFSYSLELL